MGEFFQAKLCQHTDGLFFASSHVPSRSGRPQDFERHLAQGTCQAANLNMLEHGHILEKTKILKRARDPVTCEPVRWQPGDILAVEHN